MNGKGTQSSSSLVIISRKMLIAGIAGTALFSFGLGYFFGYGGTSATRMVKQVEADNKIAPSEERTVLDSSGRPTIAPPSATPGIIPKEPPLVTRRSDSTALPPKPGDLQPNASAEKKPEVVEAPVKGEPTNSEKKAPDVRIKNKSDVVSRTGLESATDRSGKRDAESKDSMKQSGRKHAPKGSVAGGRFYTVQLGAFEDHGKAGALRKLLSKKGFKASITGYKSPEGETLSRVRIGHYATKREAEALFAGLKREGIEGVVICSRK
ncbi:MAG TPA: SPOR domain-containing protein [Dissulfurispiraceae bacterium]|nr:SPOR domain-containing protein [Dissulfurispiraceae bacterium]